MSGLLKSISDAVQRQGFEGAYIPQAIPGLGALASIPTALVSGVKAIVKFAQAIFQRIAEGKPFFKPTDKSMDAVKFPMEDAKDLGLIFINNMANIATLGILNCVVVIYTINDNIVNKNVEY